MAHQYLAFDIETAKDVPGDDFNWRPHRPLGISCAATLASDSEQSRLWYSKTRDGQPEKQMSRENAQELVQYLSSMAADGFRVLKSGRICLRNDRTIVFVCGGPMDSSKTSGESQRKKFLDWAGRELHGFVFLLAEDALDRNLAGESREFVSLTDFEGIVASVADGLLICPESPGSHAEIGFFSNSPNIRTKTLVANLLEYQTQESFLNLGPIHQISSGSKATFLPLVHLTESSGTIDFAPIGARLRLGFRAARKPRYLPYGRFKELKYKDRLCVAFEMVRFLEPVDTSTLLYAIAKCFKTSQTNKDLRHLLRILMALNYVEQIEAREYFRIVPGTIIADFDKVDRETVVARVKEHYARHFERSSSIMSERSA